MGGPRDPVPNVPGTGSTHMPMGASIGSGAQNMKTTGGRPSVASSSSNTYPPPTAATFQRQSSVATFNTGFSTNPPMERQLSFASNMTCVTGGGARGGLNPPPTAQTARSYPTSVLSGAHNNHTMGASPWDVPGGAQSSRGQRMQVKMERGGQHGTMASRGLRTQGIQTRQKFSQQFLLRMYRCVLDQYILHCPKSQRRPLMTSDDENDFTALPVIQDFGRILMSLKKFPKALVFGGKFLTFLPTTGPESEKRKEEIVVACRAITEALLSDEEYDAATQREFVETLGTVARYTEPDSEAWRGTIGALIRKPTVLMESLRNNFGYEVMVSLVRSGHCYCTLRYLPSDRNPLQIIRSNISLPNDTIEKVQVKMKSLTVVMSTCQNLTSRTPFPLWDPKVFHPSLDILLLRIRPVEEGFAEENFLPGETMLQAIVMMVHNELLWRLYRFDLVNTLVGFEEEDARLKDLRDKLLEKGLMCLEIISSKLSEARVWKEKTDDPRLFDFLIKCYQMGHVWPLLNAIVTLVKSFSTKSPFYESLLGSICLIEILADNTCEQN